MTQLKTLTLREIAGFKLRQLKAALPHVRLDRSWSRLSVLDFYGYDFRTVFDIGVAHGTFELYRKYPNAHYHLVDPSPAALPHMNSLARVLLAEVHPVALTDFNGEVQLDNRAAFQGATLHAEHHPGHQHNWITVAARRFDDLFFERLLPHVLVKIDVQGAEMAVLRGMGVRITDADAYIIEASTISTVQGGSEALEVVEYMGQHGFVLADVLAINHRPLDDATAQMDLLFIRDRSPLRADRRWQQ